MSENTDGPMEEFDAPDSGDGPLPNPEDVQPSFKVVDKRKYFDLIKYKPHGRQWLFHESNARFKIPIAGRRFGKSMMVGKDVQPLLMVPNKRIWIIGPTYDLSEKEFRVIWDDMIVRLGFGREPKVKKSYNKKMGNMYIEFPWNTRLEARSAERPDTLVGESLDYVIMSEAAKHNKETWTRYIYPSLTDKRGGAVLASTPEGQNWIHDLWQWGQNPEFAEWESWRYPSWENQIVFPGGREDSEIKLLERTIPREEFEQEIGALFTSFSGRIFSEFDEQTHVTSVEYDPNLPSYMAFDWGFVNPLAAIEFQIDSMQRVRVWREHYKERVILEDHLEILKHRVNPIGYKLDLCFGDAADPGSIETVCAKFAPCYGDPKSKDNWMEGVQLVKGFLKLQEVGKADEYGTPKEEPWLIIDHSCKNLIREFNNYRSSPRRGGRIELSPREAAQKYDDHALDALRYGMMHIFKLGANIRLSTAIDKSELNRVADDRGYFTSNNSDLLLPDGSSGFITRGLDF